MNRFHAKTRPKQDQRPACELHCFADVPVPPNIIENATNSRSTITQSPFLCVESLINKKVPYNTRSNYWLDIEPAVGAWQHVVSSRTNQQGIRCAATANPSPNKFSLASLVLIKVPHSLPIARPQLVGRPKPGLPPTTAELHFCSVVCPNVRNPIMRDGEELNEFNFGPSSSSYATSDSPGRSSVV